MPIGHDGIVLASRKPARRSACTVRNCWLALAKTVPVNGALVANPYRSWNEIDPSLPAERIEVLGPPPTSGTRDAFVELVMDKGCELFPEIAALHGRREESRLPDHARGRRLYRRRRERQSDRAEAGGQSRRRFGIFGYCFLEQNGDKLKRRFDGRRGAQL